MKVSTSNDPLGRVRRPGRKTLALIPARGGSERIKDKNIAGLGGKPLIAHTIETLKAVGLFDEILVSTDSESIAAVSRRHGAWVPFLRSGRTASAEADLLSAVTEALEMLRECSGFVPDVMGIFLPTAPFRSADKVRRIIHRVYEGAQAGNLLRPVEVDTRRLYYQNREGRIAQWGGGNIDHPRFLRNILSVAVYNLDWNSLHQKGITRETRSYFSRYLSWFRKNEFRYLDEEDLAGGPPRDGRWIYVSYASLMESIDINTPGDLALAEGLLRNWKEDDSRDLHLLPAEAA
jgi:hypothetical protein